MLSITRLGHALGLVAALALHFGPTAEASRALAPLPAPRAAPAGEEPDAPPGCTTTTTVYGAYQPAAITDNTTITSTLTVSGLHRDIWKIEAQTFISHTYPGDLSVFLISPYPFDVPGALTTGNGGTADNVFASTLWTDRAPIGVTEAAFVPNVNRPMLIPEGAMGEYRFHDPNGPWQLVVSDMADSDTGTLNGWNLAVTTLNELYIGASQFPHNATDKPIANPGTITSTIVVSNAGHYLVKLTAQTIISHPASGDLTLMLTAPNGLTTTLTHENGGVRANLFNNTTWTDSPIEGPGPVTDAPYVDGEALFQVQPEGAMGHFVGVDPNGTWTLTIRDSNPANAGLLKDWSLGVYTGYCQPLYLPALNR
jgi:subtilisin-like proprotein convertase family protein